MISDLHLALVEYDIAWLAVEDNLNYLDHLDFKPETHLIVLPEMFATGFCMQPKIAAQKENGSIVSWMQSFSEKHQKAVCGSVAIKDAKAFYNRLYIFSCGQLVATYNKRHLFSYSGEDKVYTAGKDRIIFDVLGWKICPQICYDLRFPVWFRNEDDYHLLLNVANWPESRISIWENLLKSRAIENMCYSLGCNRIGKDGNQLWYNGKSSIEFPSLEKLENTREGNILYYQLNGNKLLEYRKKYPFLKDRDKFTLKK